jgi:hypothetical protein
MSASWDGVIRSEETAETAEMAMMAMTERRGRVNLGLLAAQVALAAARRRDGLDLDRSERLLVEEAGLLFRELAARLRFVAAGGRGPVGRPLVPASVADSVVFPEGRVGVEAMARRYERLGADLDRLRDGSLETEQLRRMVSTYRGFAERSRTGATPALLGIG